MDYKSEQKFIFMSPKKLRFVRNAVSGMKDVSALIDYLPHVERRAGDPILKVLKTAVANAKQAGTNISDLIVKEMMINEGPRLRRGRAGSRGRLKPYKKLMSHIRVVLTTRNDQLSNSKLQVEKKKAVEEKDENKMTSGKQNEASLKKAKTKK